VVWATYGFSYHPAAATGRDVDWRALAGDGTALARARDWLRHTRALPEPYIYNFFHHVHLAGRFPGFLLGDVRPGGWWYYFVVTFLLKTPVPLLLLFGLARLTRVRPAETGRLATLFLVIPAAGYFVSISASGFNLGHRHLLVVVPFLIVLTAGVVPWARDRGLGARAVVAGLVGWYLASSLATHPHYLAYFNELAGGPGHGRRYLADSNLDWGQGLKGLKRYMDQHGIERVWLSYFGTASPDYHGIRHDPLPGSTFPGRRAVRPELLEVERLPRLPGAVAISVTNLQGVYLPFFGVGRRYFSAYDDIRPAATIGHSIVVYRFD
jgi:hypothetical protein